ncbi:MAG: GNAT family N-acyltransferase [Thermoanaerobaculia bacterium]
MPDQLTAGSKVYPLSAELLPAGEIVEGRYEARFARDLEELDAILKLRFKVFNLELGEGLESSLETRRDRDEFDPFCHHLMVIERGSGVVVGTYRIQTSSMAASGIGFYSSTLFGLSALPPEVVDDAVEVGRACIALEHRNTQVLFLLWKGLARYMAASQRRYLFGCCSLTSQDPELGKTVMRFLELRGHLHPELRIRPQPGFECYPRDFEPVPEPDPRLKLPKLFRIYLRHGAKVCGPPAIDREFKTIDYLVIFDVAAMQDRQFRKFFG